MSNLGRNFELLQEPEPRHRLGRFRLKDGLTVPIGVPLAVPTGTGTDPNGRLTLELAAEGSAPKVGTTGIGVFIWSWNWERGQDPVVTTTSDMSMVPLAAPVQLVFGTEVKVRLKNTVSRVFQGQRTYAARKMVAGVTAVTPSLAVDDLLTPGVGNDTDGYWKETSDASLAWLRVTSVNGTTGEVEAQVIF